MSARRIALIGTSAAALAALCCAGGGAPDETLETFNGLMAAKDFERAADLVYCPAWAESADADARREEYAGRLAELYDADELDYGRAEIRERRRRGPGEVEFAVSYPRRSRPSTPPVTRRLTVRKMGGGWYCVIEPKERTKEPERSA